MVIHHPVMPNPEHPVHLGIKAVPNAPKSEVVGWLGEALKVKIHAPPEDGKANAELCVFLAKILGIPKGSVRLGRGASSRSKVIEIAGMNRDQVMSLLPPKAQGA
jgi:uncharacterized protein (TIGR00251 family)